MCSANLIFFFAVSVLLSAIACTDINPETYGEGICQYPDCTPQLPPPSTYQPYAPPPPPKPISPPPPPPPAPTGYSPYGVAPPPPVGYPDNCPPPPPTPEGEYCCGQSDSPPSPPPSLYTYVNETSTSAASPPALPSAFNLSSNICFAFINILVLFAALHYV
ncbi:hypothetical protein POM88_006032 [Heracleum sosnowskyi]|uniref:Uncharacterized protein n=1 Tax=Heracleum sosnowskyi TaxID=360622 RepID=A0AAD8N4E3_9APIA|nr:hypothetical protein POM88_006032 [Heracleum sosnowskyi]